MKLYATVTSERASKGQGGNKEIDIELKAEWEKEDYRFFARLHYDLFIDSQKQKHFRLYFQPDNDKGHNELLKHLIIPATKGKQKKGKVCDECGQIHELDTL